MHGVANNMLLVDAGPMEDLYFTDLFINYTLETRRLME